MLSLSNKKKLLDNIYICKNKLSFYNKSCEHIAVNICNNKIMKEDKE